MKKLLCVICLLAAALFVNTADAAIGSPMRHGSVGVIAVATPVSVASCTTCGRAVFARRGFYHRPMRYGFHHRGLRHAFHHRHHVRRFHARRFACNRCGR